MKTFILAFVMSVLVLAVQAQAQDTAPKPQMNMAGKVHNMSGCLSKTDSNSYVIMNADPKGPKTIGIVSSTADLAPYVGQKIQITGVEVPMKDAEAMKNTPKADHYMKVSAVKKLVPACQ